MNFLQPLSAQAQQARKIYTSAASKHDVSTLFRIDYILPIFFNKLHQLGVVGLFFEVLFIGNPFPFFRFNYI